MKIMLAALFLVHCIYREVRSQSAPAPAPINHVNVVWIWFDDLGLGDVGWNGGPYPTPILDNLALTDSIILNRHLAEPVCSASRSAFLTGRYAFLSDLNFVVELHTEARVNPSLILFPKILQYRNVNTSYYGKWHLGYARDAFLPNDKGFEYGIYTRQGKQYYARSTNKKVTYYDGVFGEPSPPIKERRLELLGGGAKIEQHDTYEIYMDGSSAADRAIYIGDASYNEDLYTQGILQFIADQDGTEPFYIQYNMFTPHSVLVEPPTARPNGSAVNYSVCSDDAVFSGAECTLEANPRCVFCKQVHYASLNIEDIIDEIKANPNLDWDQTLVIITSDNGAAPTAAGDAYAFGSAMPVRGVKGSSFEGALRVPTFIKGGYIEQLLSVNTALTDNRCYYDGIVHISDWYHIFMNLYGITGGQYSPDSDHSGLDIWDHITCSCLATTAAEQATCDSSSTQRTEVMSMRMCGEASSSYDNGEKYFYATYLLQDGYKLVVNGTQSPNQGCPVSTGGDITAHWTLPGGSSFAIPNQTYYEDVYTEAKNGASNSMGATLYDSTCLNALYASKDTDGGQINNANYGPFQVDNILLFDIDNDKVEACAVDDATKTAELLSYLVTRSAEYTVDSTYPSKEIGALKAMLNSYDCAQGVAFTAPWNGDNTGSVNGIWTAFLDYYNDTCLNGDRRRRMMAVDERDVNKSYLEGYFVCAFVLVVVGAMAMVVMSSVYGNKASKSPSWADDGKSVHCHL